MESAYHLFVSQVAHSQFADAKVHTILEDLSLSYLWRTIPEGYFGGYTVKDFMNLKDGDPKARMVYDELVYQYKTSQNFPRNERFQFYKALKAICHDLKYNPAYHKEVAEFQETQRHIHLQRHQEREEALFKETVGYFMQILPTELDLNPSLNSLEEPKNGSTPVSTNS